MLRWNPIHRLVLVALVFTRSATAQQATDTMRVCLAPTSARTAGGDADAAVNAVRETFTAFPVRSNDRLTLSYRLENPDGKVLLEKSEKRKAASDGEDLLTPLVEKAAGSIVMILRPGR